MSIVNTPSTGDAESPRTPSPAAEGCGPTVGRTAAHDEVWHVSLLVRGKPAEGYEITNGNPDYPHGCVTPFVFSKERADLMAAAPEMYRALRSIISICERSFAPSHAALAMGSAAWVEGRQLREAVDAGRNALALAQGGRDA